MSSLSASCHFSGYPLAHAKAIASKWWWYAGDLAEEIAARPRLGHAPQRVHLLREPAASATRHGHHLAVDHGHHLSGQRQARVLSIWR